VIGDEDKAANERQKKSAANKAADFLSSSGFS
jgi:hypothetical protein